MVYPATGARNRCDVYDDAQRREGYRHRQRAGSFLLVPDIDGTLYALDARSRHIAWERRTCSGLEESPAVDGTSVYRPSAEGRLYALARTSVQVRWTLSVDETRAIPALGDGHLIIGSLGERALIAVH